MSQHRPGPNAPGIAFITGGARGLGNAIARSFAKEGAKGIALVDVLDEAAFEEGKAAVAKYGSKVITIRCDVTKEDQVEKAIQETVNAFGRIDYAANFAGIVGPLADVADTELDQFKKVVDINAVGVWLCIKHEIRQMKKQNSLDVEEGRPPQLGSIVNCASVNSIMSGPGTAGYSAAKHAVVGMTKASALEARKSGIRVNAVSPGFIHTALGTTSTNMGPSVDAFAGDTWKTYEARQGRVASADEIGDVVVLLSTPRFSLVNGHNLVIDGGFTVDETTGLVDVPFPGGS